MKKLRILEITVLPATANRNAMVKIKCRYYDESIKVPFNHEPGEVQPKVETALRWCKANGFNVLGYENGNGYAYIVSDTDKPIK